MNSGNGFQEGETVDDLLPEAFAVVKNAARRLCGSTLDVCGQDLPWEMVHFDVQLIGGIALHEGRIAEMMTGEGKTLVATLPLYLNALTGKNTQLVTVNDYLARRDSEWMGYLYKYLGLTVGCIQNSMGPPERKIAYGCDITYGTASEFGFDYLRDNGMAIRQEDQVQRDHFYVIVDEIDSILIDEARTPLIISGPMAIQREQPFTRHKAGVDRLVRAQAKMCNELVTDARKELEKSDEETGGGRGGAANGSSRKTRSGPPRARIPCRIRTSSIPTPISSRSSRACPRTSSCFGSWRRPSSGSGSTSTIWR